MNEEFGVGVDALTRGPSAPPSAHPGGAQAGAVSIATPTDSLGRRPGRERNRRQRPEHALAEHGRAVPRPRPAQPSTFWIDDRSSTTSAPSWVSTRSGPRRWPSTRSAPRRSRGGWPRLGLIAAESGASERTVQKAIRLLEVLGLVEVALCYEHGSNRQTSALHTADPARSAAGDRSRSGEVAAADPPHRAGAGEQPRGVGRRARRADRAGGRTAIMGRPDCHARDPLPPCSLCTLPPQR